MSRQARIAGERVRLWEERMHCLAEGTDAATGFRGLRVEMDQHGDRTAFRSFFPNDIWLGINNDGTRVTIAQYRERREMT
jgi:hypothetical protein